MWDPNLNDLAIEVLTLQLAWLRIVGRICAAIGAGLMIATATAVVSLLVDSREHVAQRR
jgi:MFS family permease